MLCLRTQAALVLAIFCASCTSLTEAECRAGDWRRVGIGDGAEGRGPGFIEAHRRACTGLGIEPDEAAWLAGRNEGLRLYCTPAKAYDVGRRGSAIREGCTPTELARLEPAYEWGREYWRLELQIRDIRSEIRAIDRHIARRTPGTAGGGGLLAQRSMLTSRLALLELRQRRYSTWP